MAPITLATAQDVTVAAPLADAERNPSLIPYYGCTVSRKDTVEEEATDKERNPSLIPYYGCVLA